MCNPAATILVALVARLVPGPTRNDTPLSASAHTENVENIVGGLSHSLPSFRWAWTPHVLSFDCFPSYVFTYVFILS